MAIFNSLGSNYDLSYVLRALVSAGSEKDSIRLKSLIEKKYSGAATLFYKGREAMTAALQILDLPEDSHVAINGFTCVAVFNAIRQAGYDPACLDLEESGGLNFTAETLKKALIKNKKIRAVIVQNTLGYPCDISKIEQICEEHKLVLIEDLAHCVGAKYNDGREAGTVGDFVALSFSQDKIIDAVSGGALVVRNAKYRREDLHLELKSVKNHLKESFYPAITYKIRKLYALGLGKPYHYLVRSLGLLSNIMDESFYDFYEMLPHNASLAQEMFKNLESQLAHRKKIASIYVENLPDKIFIFGRSKTREVVNLSSNLRFPVFVDNRYQLLKKLKEKSIYLEDIWYVDVAPDCPNAAGDSKIILNLPTHINISESEAGKICDIINEWIN